jgi:hypothetical protein
MRFSLGILHSQHDCVAQTKSPPCFCILRSFSLSQQLLSVLNNVLVRIESPGDLPRRPLPVDKTLTGPSLLHYPWKPFLGSLRDECQSSHFPQTITALGKSKRLLAKIYGSHTKLEKSEGGNGSHANFNQRYGEAPPCFVPGIARSVEYGLSHSLASPQNSKQPIENSFTDHVVTCLWAVIARTRS